VIVYKNYLSSIALVLLSPINMFPVTFSMKSPAHKTRVSHHILPYNICRVTNTIKARPILIGFLRCEDRSDRPERTSDRTRPGDIQDRPIKDRPGLRVQMKLELTNSLKLSTISRTRTCYLSSNPKDDNTRNTTDNEGAPLENMIYPSCKNY
jgi:hypothetical protein